MGIGAPSTEARGLEGVCLLKLPLEGGWNLCWVLLYGEGTEIPRGHYVPWTQVASGQGEPTPFDGQGLLGAFLQASLVRVMAPHLVGP